MPFKRGGIQRRRSLVCSARAATALGGPWASLPPPGQGRAAPQNRLLGGRDPGENWRPKEKMREIRSCFPGILWFSKVIHVDTSLNLWQRAMPPKRLSWEILPKIRPCYCFGRRSNDCFLVTPACGLENEPRFFVVTKWEGRISPVSTPQYSRHCFTQRYSSPLLIILFSYTNILSSYNKSRRCFLPRPRNIHI